MEDTSSKSTLDRFLGNPTSIVIARGPFPGAKGVGEVEMSRIFNGGGLYRRFRLASASSSCMTGEANATMIMKRINRFQHI